MQFTGSSLSIKRSFFSQTGDLGFVLNCAVDDTTGKYTFGISGSQNTLGFSLLSGYMYYNNQYINSYQSNQEFSLSAQFSSGTINVIKDGVALVYGQPHNTGIYDTFYFTRENAGTNATFDLEISGDNIPNFYISPIGYLSSTGQNAVTGSFVNRSNYPMRVFSSEIQSTVNYSFGQLSATISPGGSGAFALSGDFNALDFSQPIITTFHTNFDDVLSFFNIIDTRSLNRFVYITAPTDFSINSTGQVPRNLTYINYSGGFVTNSFESNITFGLSYNNGGNIFTGVWDLLTGVSLSSLVSLKRPGNYDSTMISGSGQFAANGQVAFQVNYTSIGDTAQLIISGGEVRNPINTIISY